MAAACYQLPPVVQGGVVAAVGSSFPELSSAVLATLLHDDFGLGVAAMAGSAIFNITVIPAASASAVLTLVTILLFAFMRTRLVLSKPEAVTLLVLYAGFVGWIFAGPV